jgi:cytidine deaminase
MARLSYAPYTKNWSGVALLDGNGRRFGGPYLESVAFNPSLGPLQGALVAMRLNQIDWGEIRDVVLVQSAASQANLEPATRSLLATMSQAPLRTYRARIAA